MIMSFTSTKTLKLNVALVTSGAGTNREMSSCQTVIL